LEHSIEERAVVVFRRGLWRRLSRVRTTLEIAAHNNEGLDELAPQALKNLGPEARITYRFHPRFGEVVQIRRRLESGGVEFVVVLQPDGSFASLLDAGSALLKAVTPTPKAVN
jgi:hypothetical protein